MVFGKPIQSSLGSSRTLKILKILVWAIAYTSIACHHADHAMLHSIQSKFFWSTMEADIRLLANNFIHSISTLGGEVSHTLDQSFDERTKRPSTVRLYWISLEFRRCKVRFAHWDDNLGYYWLSASPEAASYSSTSAIIGWSPYFGVPNEVFFGSPMQFLNETLRLVLEIFLDHTFPFYCIALGIKEKLSASARSQYSVDVHQFQSCSYVLKRFQIFFCLFKAQSTMLRLCNTGTEHLLRFFIARSFRCSFLYSAVRKRLESSHLTSIRAKSIWHRWAPLTPNEIRPKVQESLEMRRNTKRYTALREECPISWSKTMY